MGKGVQKTMKFIDAVKIVHPDEFESWWKGIDADQSYIDECVQQQQEEEEQQGEQDGESIRSNI